MITLAVLDIAGTTVEEHQAVYAALAKSVTEAGVTVSDSDLRDWMGADKRAAIRGLLTRAGHVPNDAEVAETFSSFRRRLDDGYAANPPTALPGVPEAFEKLREDGIRIALTTGFDREVTRSVLAAVGWDDTVVDIVVCGDDVPEGRPAPYMIFRAMEATGTHSVREVLTAGDTVLDLRAGTNAGAAYVVGVLTGGQGRAKLATTAHTHIIPSVAGLPELLGIGAIDTGVPA